MANPIQKTDLISDEALRALEEMSRLLREDKENMDALMASFKQYAGSIQPAVAANNSNNDALAAALQKVSELEKAYSDLQKLMKENAATQKAVAAEKRKYAKLTEEEATDVKNLRMELKWLNDEDKEVASYVKKKIEAINAEKMSYNQLQQTYNAVRDALNKMTPEQLKSTEAGKLLAAQGLKIRDAMNEMQKATGNYTLQVGKYKAAFDGLGYSFQQILREAPSALNIQQFFLAISNNIPLFMDQLKGYQKQQEEIKESLKVLEAEGKQATEEYAKLANNVEGWGKHLLRSLLSWQTAIIAITMLFRLYGDKIINWFKNLLSKTKEVVSYLTELRSAIISINKSVFDSTAAVNVELEEILRRLPEINTGTKEWADNVGRISELTNGLVNSNEQNLQSIKDATEEYRKQAEQLAKNKFAVEFIAENVKKQWLAEQFMNAGSAEEAARILGVSKDDKKEYEAIVKQFQRRVIRNGKEIVNPSVVYADDRMESEDDKRRRRQAYANSFLGVSSNETVDEVWRRYYKAMATQKPKGNGAKEKQFDFSPSDVDDEYWKAEQARIRMMENGYDMEIDLQRVKHQEMLEQNDVWQGKREEQLMDNLMGELTLLTNGNEKAAEQMFNAIVKNDTEAVQQMSAGAQQLAQKYWSDVEEGQRQHDLIMQGLIIDNNEAIKAINQKYDKEQMDAIQEQYKAEMKVVSRRSRTIVQEQQKNADLAYNINVLRQEMEALTTAQYKDNDSKEEAAQRAAALSKEIEKLRKQMQFEKQLSNYGSIWDIFQRNGAFEASNGTMRGIAKNLLGDLADSLDDKQIEQVYDTWLQNTQKAATEWYNTTMGYINDLISAYVELANAKAEAAAEATEAAQEEYDKEKALLEAGYASRVEATWAEYQEKKAAQEKAEADAKAAAQAQKELNEISTAGNMIVAASNIWKTFSAMGPVGMAAAVAAITAMFGAFVQSKIKANEVSKYGEGGFEVLEGGSHASGHDIDLGVRNRRGRRMRAEGREGLGIFSRRAMAHYGANNIEAMVNSVNRLEFEGNAAKRMSLERSVGMAVLSAPRTDLRRLENSVDKLVGYGSRNVTVLPDGSVREVRKNGTITIKKG